MERYGMNKKLQVLVGPRTATIIVTTKQTSYSHTSNINIIQN